MGFYPKKSVVTALLLVLHDWHQFLAKGFEVCAVFFDLRKAFDTVLHALSPALQAGQSGNWSLPAQMDLQLSVR